MNEPTVGSGERWATRRSFLAAGGAAMVATAAAVRADFPPGEITHDEAVAAVEQFAALEGVRVTLPQDGPIQGVQLVKRGNMPRPRLEVIPYPGHMRGPHKQLPKIPKEFTYKYEGNEGPAQRRVEVHEVDIELPALNAVAIGDDARRRGAGDPPGTAGWNIWFHRDPNGPGEAVCITSWHVLNPGLNNAPAPGDPVWLNGGLRGTFLCNQVIRLDGTLNKWDLAMVRLNPNQLTADIAACDHAPHGYPKRLATSVVSGPGYHKTGFASGCSYGRYEGSGTRAVPYGNEIALFHRQLLFPNSMCTGGDSGALIVRDTDPLYPGRGNVVTGLHMARDGTNVIANPMLELPWEDRGNYPVGSKEVPIYGPESAATGNRCW